MGGSESVNKDVREEWEPHIITSHKTPFCVHKRGVLMWPGVGGGGWG